MDLEALNKFSTSLEPSDQKKFYELLEMLGRIQIFSKKIAALNTEYFNTYQECSNIICDQLGAKTNWNKEKIHQMYNLPFLKICAEFDSINDDIKIKSKEWGKSRGYCREIFTIIEKKGKNDKVIKGIDILFKNNIKQMREMRDYYDKVTILHQQMKEFKKKLDVFIN